MTSPAVTSSGPWLGVGFLLAALASVAWVLAVAALGLDDAALVIGSAAMFMIAVVLMLRERTMRMGIGLAVGSVVGLVLEVTVLVLLLLSATA
jgi:hypothetical protein